MALDLISQIDSVSLECSVSFDDDTKDIVTGKTRPLHDTGPVA